MKRNALFSSKDKVKKNIVSSATIWLGALRVNMRKARKKIHYKNLKIRVS